MGKEAPSFLTHGSEALKENLDFQHFFFATHRQPSLKLKLLMEPRATTITKPTFLGENTPLESANKSHGLGVKI